MLERYSRQTLFRPIGLAGQQRLQASTVMVVGCGALGTVLANNLCRAGIGHLVIADRDYVEKSLIYSAKFSSMRMMLADTCPKQWPRLSTCDV